MCVPFPVVFQEHDSASSADVLQIRATRVQIVDPKKPKERIEARLEQGAWRIHMPDIATMLSGNLPRATRKK
jgi:hypothetical protein